MTKTFHTFILCLAVTLSVLNFEFRLLEFVWDLWFDAWDLHDFPYASNFIGFKPLFFGMTQPRSYRSSGIFRFNLIPFKSMVTS